MTNQNDELGLMRQQMHELKQVINEQNIINEQLLRQVMASKSAWIRRFSRLEIFILLPYIILVFLLLKYQAGLSWLFYGATVVMVTISIGFRHAAARPDGGPRPPAPPSPPAIANRAPRGSTLAYLVHIRTFRHPDIRRGLARMPHRRYYRWTDWHKNN